MCRCVQLQLESSFLSDKRHRNRLEVIMTEVFEKLNFCGLCTVNIGQSHIHQHDDLIEVLHSYSHLTQLVYVLPEMLSSITGIVGSLLI